MSRLSRSLVPSVLAIALLTALVMAASASAEVRTGEGSNPTDLGILGETDLLHASASYDSRTGTAVVEMTAREAPGPQPKAQPAAVLATVKGPCDRSVIETGEEGVPRLLVSAGFEVEPASGWSTVWRTTDAEGALDGPALGSWSLEGTTSTLTVSATPAIGQPYNCAFVYVGEQGHELGESSQYVFFPLNVPKPVEPMAPGEPTKPADPVVKTVPPPAPAAGKLAIAKANPLNAKAGKWTKAAVKITNGGGTAVGPVTIKAKAPAGVALQAGTMKVPALLPGQSWTVNFRVKVGAAAKSTSTIALAATGPDLSATGSLTLNRQGS